MLAAMKNRTLCATLFALLSCAAAFAQGFEVASIKPAGPMEMNKIRIGMSTDKGMLRYTNVSLRDCIRIAYHVKDFQVDGPDWINSTRFDIEAKFPDGATEEQVPEMLQALLAERFKLVVHRESKEHPIYALVAGKNGAKLKAAESKGGNTGDADSGPNVIARTGAPLPRGAMMMRMSPGGMHLQTPSVTLAGLSEALSRFMERPIVDMTGIEGQYDFDLSFMPETMGMARKLAGIAPGADHSAPPPDANIEQAQSLFDAIAAYGLKLEPRKAPVEIVTVDRIEKTPTDN